MKKPFYASIALHIAVVIVILLDLPFLYSKPVREFKDDLPIMIDLSQLKIAEKTNLPKKIEKKKEVKQEVKKEDKTPKVDKKPAPVLPPPPKVEPKKEAKADVKAVETKKAEEKKAEPKKDEKVEQKKKADERKNDIKTLLASVEKIKASIKDEPISKSDKGVKDGVAGNYMQDLTISEKDAIAAKMRDCWNLDPGAKGISDMLVEVRVSLRSDGTVAKAEIVDSSRKKSDAAFSSVADSALRAVYVCGKKGEESPFYLLASRHPDKYEMWQDLVLFFNPLTGGVL